MERSSEQGREKDSALKGRKRERAKRRLESEKEERQE